MSEPLVASTFLFRFSVACLRIDDPHAVGEIQLPAKYAIPSFSELDGRSLFADLRIGWHESGIAVSLRVRKKKQQPWCRASRLDDSDGLWLFIDTRNTQSIHRASRFCHHLVLLPQGRGRQFEQPVAALKPIQRAREDAKPIKNGLITLRSEERIDGYLLRAMIPADAITGYDPVENPALGFSYAVIDRELGWQTFSIGSEFPFTSNPSLWGTLELQ